MAKDDARDAGPIGGAQQAAVSRYSRRVRLLKYALPVVSVALVGAIFASGRGEQDVSAFLTPAEIARLAAGIKLEGPRFVGQTEAGEPFVLRAATAEPDGAVADRIRLAQPTGEIELSDGRELTGRADTGVLHRNTDRLVLEGDVQLETSDGQLFETDRLIIRIGDRVARSPGPVRGSGPSGTIEAGAMRLVTEEATDGAEGAGPRIFFRDGVRVIFIPSGEHEPEAAAAAVAPGGEPAAVAQRRAE